jgi:hypothetical protein
MKTTNLPNSFISVAEDCPVYIAEIPPARDPKTIPGVEFDTVFSNPYEYTSDDALYEANAKRRGINRQEFFAKKQPDFRLSPLTQRYGWGVHSDENGKIALYAVESVEYEMFANDASLTQLKGNRSKRN